ncbi:hypothetical protein M5K25_017288 [Dendrobium thyrsiflorum]|uniref:Uncharacterized protein n=1 Tax=Dendrobium thyrsiflorum TaxID=117978 RepID=A0ABD0UM50_DENTH
MNITQPHPIPSSRKQQRTENSKEPKHFFLRAEALGWKKEGARVLHLGIVFFIWKEKKGNRIMTQVWAVGLVTLSMLTEYML